MSEQAILPGPGVALAPAASGAAETSAVQAPALQSRRGQLLGQGCSWVASLLVHVATLLCIAVFAPALAMFRPAARLDLPRTITPLTLRVESSAAFPIQALPLHLQPREVELEIRVPKPPLEVLSEEPVWAVMADAKSPPEEPRFDPLPPTPRLAWSACEHLPLEFSWPRANGGGSRGKQAATAGDWSGPQGQGAGAIGAGTGSGGGSGSGSGGMSGSALGQGLGYGYGSGQGIGNGTGDGTGALPKGPTRAVRVVKELAPVYPEAQRQAGRTASVLLEILVDPNGKPVSIEVLTKAVPEDFIRAALSAAKSARYEPALEVGRPVSGYVRRRIEFRLK